MNMHKIILLSLGWLILAKTDQATAQLSDLVGLRCEFNGRIQFYLSQEQVQATVKIVNEVRHENPNQLSDATELHELRNGGCGSSFSFACNPLQWVWLMRNTRMQLLLIPDSDPTIKRFSHGDVYFFNVFNSLLELKLSQEGFQVLDGKIHIRVPKTFKEFMPKWRYDSDKKEYLALLEPGQAIVYPVSSKINLTLETLNAR